MKLNLFLATLITAGLLAFTSSTIAASIYGLPEGASEETTEYKYPDSWSFYVAPHVWFAALNGHSNFKRTRATFSTPFSKIREDLDFSLGAEMEANKGVWTFILDPDFVKITQKLVVKGIDSNTTYDSTMTDIGAYYRLYSLWSPRRDYLRTSVELLGAARIITLHTAVRYINTGISTPSDATNLIVPYLGIRFKYSFNPCWHTFITAGVGGFEVTHVSSTLSAAAGVSYNFTKAWDVTLAYKTFALNYSTNNNTMNSMLQGPVLGFGYAW